MTTWVGRAVMVAAMSAAAAVPAMAQGTMTTEAAPGAPAKQPPASPPDTARATIGGAHIMVAYSRPYKKGRVIFGGLVPYDQVWRTGANAATTLVTDKDLTIGGTAVPAGTYTVYTLPSQSGWKLIVNKQTKQWGTEYHQDQDLARIPMTMGTVSPSVEQFVIAIVPNGNVGTLKLTWDTTEASVPVSVK